MALILLDTENADYDLTTEQTVLGHTPSATLNMWCQGYIELGDGTKDLDGSGGNFELAILNGGQSIQPRPQTIAFSTHVRAAIWTDPFPVPANKNVLLKIKSPNAGDTDVDVTAYLFDIQPGPLNTDYTAARAGYLDELAAANIPADLDATLADTNELQTDLVDGGRLDLLVDAIKAKTDNLPNDPADESLLEAAITAAESNIRGSDSDDLKDLSDQIDAVSGGLLTTAEIADAIMDEDKTGHTGSLKHVSDYVEQILAILNKMGLRGSSYR
jgi:hypothetical protein